MADKVTHEEIDKEFADILNPPKLKITGIPQINTRGLKQVLAKKTPKTQGITK